MNKTPIEWVRTYRADGTWTPGYTVNPIRARWKDLRLNGGRSFHLCQKISPGCKNCYSSRFQPRFGGLPFDETAKAALDRGEIEIYLDEQVIAKVLRFRKSAACFPFDMTDLFGDWVPDEMIDTWWAVMALTPNVAYRILTKRAERMLRYLSGPDRTSAVAFRAMDLYTSVTPFRLASATIFDPKSVARGEHWVWRTWPLPNVQLGISAENQTTFDERWKYLKDLPAAVRFVSYEPALGPLDIHNAIPLEQEILAGKLPNVEGGYLGGPFVQWVIAGGESGPGARPPHPDWFRSVRDQCRAAGVPFFFKQNGAFVADPRAFRDRLNWIQKAPTWVGRTDVLVDLDGKICRCGADMETARYPVAIMTPVPKKAAGRDLDGREWNEFPILQ